MVDHNNVYTHHHRSVIDTASPSTPPPPGVASQLIGRFFFFKPSFCVRYGNPFVIQSGAGSPFR